MGPSTTTTHGLPTPRTPCAQHREARAQKYSRCDGLKTRWELEGATLSRGYHRPNRTLFYFSERAHRQFIGCDENGPPFVPCTNSAAEMGQAADRPKTGPPTASNLALGPTSHRGRQKTFTVMSMLSELSRRLSSLISLAYSACVALVLAVP
jgi:hypothetical protein